MKKVYKYALVFGIFSLYLPVGAVPLKAAMQDGVPMIWCLVDPFAASENRKFFVAGTGQEINDKLCSLVFVDTFFVDELVFHVFELT